MAPVKAPFSCPKSSLSMRVSGTAAQFRATNRRDLRSDKSWSIRATSSFPVPLSPTTSTEALLGPTVESVS